MRNKIEAILGVGIFVFVLSLGLSACGEKKNETQLLKPKFSDFHGYWYVGKEAHSGREITRIWNITDDNSVISHDFSVSISESNT
ncbi:MAG: hypothetical protein HY843_00210, partial [Bdellovibrio sp.]|nr:hypothetical protein [Bdellovibrio sp.]